MTLPARSVIQQAATADISQSGTCHPGLVFDRYADTWNVNKDGQWHTEAEKKQPAPKTHFLDTFCTRFAAWGKAPGAIEMLKTEHQRHASLRASLEARGWTVKTGRFSTRWRFVTGLGNSHPFETGFTFHHTLGVPYLAGSSVKGACLDVARTSGVAPEIGRAVFGTDEDAGNAGGAVFFDLLPEKWPTLDVDVVTPHYGRYYEGKDVPGDWLSPVPSPFLTVAPGQTFVAAVALKPGIQAHIDDVWKMVVEAATSGGFGGKSAVGYGYFDVVR